MMTAQRQDALFEAVAYVERAPVVGAVVGCGVYGVAGA